MKHELNLRDVKRIINQSVDALDQRTVNRLAQVRQNALAALPSQQLQAVLHGTGSTHVAGHTSHVRVGYVAAALVLIASLFSCVTYWQNINTPDDGEVDIAILTDEMPLEVFTD